MEQGFLEQCEREALNLSGAIQAHGCLVILDRFERISHVSANVAQYLGGTPETWLDQALPDALLMLARQVDNTIGSRRTVEAVCDGPCGLLDMVVSRGHDNALILEFTLEGGSMSAFTAGPPVTPPTSERDIVIQRQALTERIADITGFQRVMYYRFREDDDGEVVAESRRGNVYGSYLGLRFPASDIPRVARQLYLKNPWRQIPDASAPSVPIFGRNIASPDLTWSDLRSVSPVHAIYLANMGVRASLSFPVVVGGNLIALIAAHHEDARSLPIPLLEKIAALVRAHAFAKGTYQSQQRMRLIDGLTRRFDDIRLLIQRHGDLLSSWPELSTWLMEEFRVDGINLLQNDIYAGAGLRLEDHALSCLDQWFCNQMGESVWMGDSLSRQIPGFGLSQIAGAIAIRIGNPVGGLRIYLTRSEHIHEVAWGGNPEKPEERRDGALGISPRQSFERWVEKRLGYCRPWTNESRLLGLKLRELLHQEIRT